MPTPIKKRNLFKTLFITSSVLLIGTTAGIPITYYLVPQKNSGGGGGDTPAGEVSLETTYPFLQANRNKIMNVHGLASNGKYHISYVYHNPSTGDDYIDSHGGIFEIINNKEITYSTTLDTDSTVSSGMQLGFTINIIDDSTNNEIFTKECSFYWFSGNYDQKTIYSNISDINGDTWTKIATTDLKKDEFSYYEYIGFYQENGTFSKEILAKTTIVDETTKDFSIEIKFSPSDTLHSVTGHFILWDFQRTEQMMVSPQLTIGKGA